MREFKSTKAYKSLVGYLEDACPGYRMQMDRGNFLFQFDFDDPGDARVRLLVTICVACTPDEILEQLGQWNVTIIVEFLNLDQYATLSGNEFFEFIREFQLGEIHIDTVSKHRYMSQTDLAETYVLQLYYNEENGTLAGISHTVCLDDSPQTFFTLSTWAVLSSAGRVVRDLKKFSKEKGKL